MAFERLGEKIPLFLRTDRILFRGTVDDDAKKIRSEQLGEKPETTVAALGQGNARDTALVENRGWRVAKVEKSVVVSMV